MHLVLPTLFSLGSLRLHAPFFMSYESLSSDIGSVLLINKIRLSYLKEKGMNTAQASIKVVDRRPLV